MPSSPSATPESTPAAPGRWRRGTVLVTGGAGFIGSHLAIALSAAQSGGHVIALDNLRRRGSAINVERLRRAGVEFVHGDVRVPDDLTPAGPELALIVDCAADPAVLAGYSGPASVIASNLIGTANCLELAKRSGADVLFLSTSRVYPIERLNEVPIVEGETRFEMDPGVPARSGLSRAGVNERFPLDGVRTLYGATKLASELLIQEYAAICGFDYVINRLGVVSGPGQMGKVEQGVFSYWMAQHYFGGELTYRGWGGLGKQLRDLLHVEDVCRLVLLELECWERVRGRIYNVGGGAANTLSLREATDICREFTGRELRVRADLDTHPSDVRLYYTDCAAISSDIGWRPTRDPRAIFLDLLRWLEADAARLRPLFVSGREAGSG